MDRTTDLKLVKHGARFTWGEVIKIHEVGKYAIIEHHPWKVDGVSVLSCQPDIRKREFSIYVNGKNCSRGYDNLDAALVGCIAYKHDGHSYAGDCFMRMLRK